MADLLCEKLGATEFTVGWLTDILKKRCNAGDVDLISYTSKDITGGIGFLSVVLRLTMEWRGDDAHNLPNSIICKIPGLSGANSHFDALPWNEEELKQLAIQKENNADGKDEAFLVDLHKKEMDFYRTFANCGLPLPTFYHGIPFDPFSKKDGIIVMQDMSERTAMVNMADGLNMQQVEAVLSCLAKLHAYSLQLPSEQWEPTFTNNDSFANDEFTQFTCMVAGLLPRIKPEWFDGAYQKVAPLFTTDVIIESVDSHKRLGMPSVLVHGDLWSSNLLWHADETGKPTAKLAAIIDWQMTHPGNCCEDIVRLLFTCTPVEFRRSNLDRLLSFYHQELCGHFSGQTPPYSLEQVHQSYDVALPYGMIFALFGVPMWMNIKAIVDGEHMEERQIEILRRAKGIIEDVIQSRNL